MWLESQSEVDRGSLGVTLEDFEEVFNSGWLVYVVDFIFLTEFLELVFGVVWVVTSAKHIDREHINLICVVFHLLENILQAFQVMLKG